MVQIASGQIGLVDLNDTQASPTQPTNPTNGSLWLNTTNNQLYVYNSGSWQVSTQGLTLGGTNMILNSDFSQGTTAGSSTPPTNWTFFGARTVIYSGQGNTNYNNPRTLYIGHDTVDSGIQQTINGIKTSTQYTMSFSLGKENINNCYAQVNYYNSSNTLLSSSVFNYDFTKQDTYQHFTFTTPSTFDHAVFVHGGTAVTFGSSYITRLGSVQLEIGANASDWSPDPADTSSQIVTINNSLTDLADDNKISRFERSLVRQQINNITGLWLNPTDSMPTLAAIDAGGVGSLYSLRKSARDIGADTTPGVNYTNVGTNYTTLANYLNSLSPKPWDTALADTASTPVTATTWNTDWKSYNDSFSLLQVDVTDRQKSYTDTAASNAQSGAIAAVQNAVAHATVNIANPVVINAPVATIGLPEFQGFHFDSWTWNGRNLLMNTGATNGTTSFSLSTGVTLDTTTQDGGINSFKYVLSGLVADTWSSANPTLVPATAATVYSASADVYIPTGATFDYGKPTLEIQFFNSSGTRLSAVTVATGYADLTKTNQWQTVYIPNITAPANTATANCRVWIQRNGSCWVSKLKLETGATAHSWTAAPEDGWGHKQNRIQPITNPTFSTGTLLTMNVMMYGDGTNNDSLVWDANGNLVRTQLWVDTNLSGAQNWNFVADFTGYKQVKATAFATDVTNSTVQAVKYDASYLTAVSSFTAGDQVSLANTDNALNISIKDTDSGWGETYTPTGAEMDAYFLGWRLCNGTYNTPYNGTGTKTWYPIGDADLTRAANTANGVPTTAAPTIAEGTVNSYQVVYRNGTPVQVTGYTFDGVLTLIQGNNTVNIYYPSYTPAITTGTIKYATNLATATQDVTYIIPTIQKRVSSAESKTTDSAIINTVTNSVSYQTALQGKANSQDLSNYATSDALNNLSGTVSDLSGTVNGINSSLSTFVTTTAMNTTATGIKESFYKSGGMNLAYNSVGYDGLNFWTNYSSYPIQAVQNQDLDNQGFGSGFYFKPDGQNKGISQDIKVIPGQHYTLSWYLNKLNSGGDSTYRFFIQILENGTIIEQIADNSGTTTTGYTPSYMQYTASATATTVTIRFIGYANVEAYISGIMFTIGDTPIQWTLATGESYNTTVRTNINGIFVSHIDANGNETGYTQISSDEFAGYNSPNNDGTFEKVFYLNGDETVSKKMTATDEITMGNIKIIPITSSASTGWAFIPNN